MPKGKSHHVHHHFPQYTNVIVMVVIFIVGIAIGVGGKDVLKGGGLVGKAVGAVGAAGCPGYGTTYDDPIPEPTEDTSTDYPEDPIPPSTDYPEDTTTLGDTGDCLNDAGDYLYAGEGEILCYPGGPEAYKAQEHIYECEITNIDVWHNDQDLCSTVDYCGDGKCIRPENPRRCPKDCCNKDGECNNGETEAMCPWDCPRQREICNAPILPDKPLDYLCTEDQACVCMQWGEWNRRPKKDDGTDHWTIMGECDETYTDNRDSTIKKKSCVNLINSEGTLIFG